MDSKTTQGTSRASMIILATVVFPEALPPPRPVGRVETLSTVAQPSSQMSPSGACHSHTASSKLDRGAQAMLVTRHQRRRWTLRWVPPFYSAVPPDGGFGPPFLPRPCSPMAKASLDWVPCSLYHGGRPAV